MLLISRTEPNSLQLSKQRREFIKRIFVGLQNCWKAQRTGLELKLLETTPKTIWYSWPKEETIASLAFMQDVRVGAANSQLLPSPPCHFCARNLIIKPLRNCIHCCCYYSKKQQKWIQTGGSFFLLLNYWSNSGVCVSLTGAAEPLSQPQSQLQERQGVSFSAFYFLEEGLLRLGIFHYYKYNFKYAGLET